MKHSPKITIIMLSLFILSQLIGLLTISQYIDIKSTAESGNTQINEDLYLIQPPGTDDNFSFIYITIGIIIGTILLLLIIKYSKHLLWKAWFFVAVLLALTIALNPYIIWLFAKIGLQVSFINIITLFVALSLAYFKVFKFNPIIHNITELLVYAGIASLIVPILTLSSIVILLIIISVYDIYAVWKSKHMVKLAKFQTKTNNFAGLLIPKQKIKKAPKGIKGKEVKVKSAILGGGDITFPLLFNGVYLKYSGDILGSLIIVATCTLTLAGLFYLSKKNKFYPAMPFLSMGCLLGFIISVII
jgi:presenilin-like A22 family membrane protease